MIIVSEGKPGMGKTTYGADVVQRALWDSRTYVATSLQLVLPKGHFGADRLKILPIQNTMGAILSLPYSSLFKKYKRIYLILDEFQMVANSRKWKDLPEEFEYLMQQHRHYKVDVLGLLQSVKRADTIVRELMQVFYRIQKIIVIPQYVEWDFRKSRFAFLRWIGYKKIAILGRYGPYGFFFKREFDPDSVDVEGRDYKPISFLGIELFSYVPFIVPPSVYRMFDTYEKYPVMGRPGQLETLTYRVDQVQVLKKTLIERKVEDTLAGSLDPLDPNYEEKLEEAQRIDKISTPRPLQSSVVG